MNSKKPKKSRSLKVRVSFEAGRLSDEYLARAYEEVAPELLRRTEEDIQRPFKISGANKRNSINSAEILTSTDFVQG